jgi:hypothetical protein
MWQNKRKTTKNSLKTGQMAAMKRSFRVSVREILASEPLSGV